MFNPVSKANWVYQYFFENEVKDDTLIIHSTYTDNKFLDEDVVDNLNLLAERNPAYYRIYALGEFATLDKLVFPNYTKELLNFNELRHLPSFFGLDFGYTNDPSAFMHVKVDTDNKRLYILEEYVKTGMLNDEIATVIQSLGYSKEVITADSAEIKSIAELQRRHGIERIRPARKGQDSVLNGIQYIHQYELIVDERCFNTINELENYTWQKDRRTNEYINKPVDSFNHCIDAIRYAIEQLILQSNAQHNKPTQTAKMFKRLGL